MTREGSTFHNSDGVDADEAITAQAAAWYALFLSGEATESDERRFEAWLQSDRRREAVYTELVKTWERVDALSPVFENDISESAPAATRAPVAPFLSSWRGGGRFGAAARVGAAAVTAVFLVFATYAYYQHPVYEAIVASQDAPVTQALADGSSVQLNASTQLEVSFTRSKRRIELLSGQAFFDVAKDPSRPFVVGAGDRSVVAVGTAFDVIKKRNGVIVTMHEGIVDVIPTPAAAKIDGEAAATVRLAAREQLGYERGFSPVVRVVEPDSVSAWRRGRIELRGVSLADAVEQINLYSDRRLVLTDRSLRDVRLDFSGPLGPQTADAFLSAIEIKYAVRPVDINPRTVYLKRGAARQQE